MFTKFHALIAFTSILFSINSYANTATPCTGQNCHVKITYDGSTKPCIAQNCPLPANFDYIISCCSNSASDRQHFTEIVQNSIANQQQLIYAAHDLRQKKLITQNTYQIVIDYVQWVADVTNQQIKDWPDPNGKEWIGREQAALDAIHNDENTH